MTRKGMKVMINELLGDNGKTAATVQGATDKTIAALEIVQADNGFYEDSLVFLFDDGSRMRLYDDGQCCCESRYMHTDDVLADFVGARFINAQIQDGPEVDNEDGVTESQFLIVTTSIGAFTVVNYNEHNGYYGGFSLKAEPIDSMTPAAGHRR